MIDRRFMARALALAERGRGRTSPNPMVGAVVVDDEGVVVGRGSHEFAGGPHAEVHALRDAGPRARGATLYCTLEPCCHTGRTGPCAPLVADAGIHRVVIATDDPNPLVAGEGRSYLRRQGVHVEVGVLADRAARLNGPFFTVMRERRPFVTMKVALSRDGYVAAAGGTRTALTGSTANRHVHRERAEVDALAAGSGTILADDPLLTARGAYRVRPLTRIVFDRSLLTPPASRLFSTRDAGPIIVVSTARQDAERRTRHQALTSAGARIELVEAEAGGEFLRQALHLLAAQGVGSITLEGGPQLHRAAWIAGLVDRVQIFETGRVLGAGSVPWLPHNVFTLESLVDVRRVPLGDDVMMEGYVHRAG
jgi:diaminohydroxyphosphoribosylaminopyrimidine deaminase / 5-amino-6-(5-phosphoribosylamino)uracil reductase